MSYCKAKINTMVLNEYITPGKKKLKKHLPYFESTQDDSSTLLLVP